MFDQRDILEAFNLLKDLLDDFSPLFERWRDEFYIVQTEYIFDTDGLGTWDPTTRPNPILRDTYDLFNSYTDINDPNFQETISGTRVSFDTGVYYADWHEQGTSRFVARPVAGLIDFDDPELERISQEYADEDLLPRVQSILDRVGVSL